MRARDIQPLMWAIVALGAVYIIRKLQYGITQIPAVYEGAVNRTANLIEQFFPLVDSNSLITHAVTFPDGSRHAVPGETVDRNGFFTYGGARFRLMVSPTSGQKIAVTA